MARIGDVMRRLVVSLFLLVVLALSTAAQNAAGDDYFVQAEVDNPRPFIGQQIIYDFKLYDAIGLNNPSYEPSDFEGFWRVDLGGVSQHVEQLNGRQYTVSEIKTALFPTRAGAITIAPAGIVIPETVFAPKQEVKANPVVVQVQPLPDGAPQGFSGAVGQFQMGATLSDQQIKLGEPVTLEITITGSGNVEQLPLPSATLPPTWRSYENPATYNASQQNDKVIGSKVYQLLIFPDQVGSQALPTVSLVYFDPAALAYRSVSTSPVSIQVLPSNSDIGTPQSVAVNSTQSSSLALKPIAALTTGDARPGFGLWLLFVIPVAVIAGAWGWRIYQKRTKRDRATTRQTQALKVAFGRLDSARKLSSQEAYRQAQNAVLGYIADRLDADLDEKFSLDWQPILAAQNKPRAMIERLQNLIELANQGLYAPDGAGEIKPLIEQITKTLSDVDRGWNKSS